MELIGSNMDSSGVYQMFLEGGVLVTLNGPSETTLVETARQTLRPATDIQEPTADDWYAYGVNGHTCDIHIDGDLARIDGMFYELVDVDVFAQ